MKPHIAITATTEELRNKEQTTIPIAYAKAIEEAGGIPFIVPILNSKENIVSAAESFDGFLFSGGDDIRPGYYGEEALFNLEVSPDERTDFELNLLKEILILKKPVLGICLGVQLINVAFGGSLYQDICSQISNPLNHRSPHSVSIKENTLLHRILGIPGPSGDIVIQSGHHQAVKVVGKGLVVSAVSSDGVIEAIESPDYPFLAGVQWHPEREAGSEYTKKLFNAFVSHSRCHETHEQG
ncbi:MAG: gamma-glutamyl-gamma-aminobutyrate hydrolase family protein [Nitrospira sp.]|nr:gamma-glutamyl-gamma-aminobutyrate hydrolase family protein [Nitrospira sp.]